MKNLSISSSHFIPSNAAPSEIDIDVKPMMNVLLILIPFLVSLAVYTRLTVIELSLPPDITSASFAGSTEKPKLKLTVVVAPDYLQITQAENVLDSIPRVSEEFPYDALAAKLSMRRDGADIKDEVVVASRDKIAFKHVVRVMDICRKAGFEKVNLASAPEGGDQGL